MATVDGTLYSITGLLFGGDLKVLPPLPPVANNFGVLYSAVNLAAGDSLRVLPPQLAVSNAAGSLIPRTDRIKFGVAGVIPPSEYPRVITVAGAIRFYQGQPGMPGDTGQLTSVDIRRIFFPATGSELFLASAGRISHARVFAAYRNQHEAEQVHLSMRNLES